MFAVNQENADRLVGGVSKELGAPLLERFLFVGNRLGLCRIFRRLKDEAGRDAMIRELGDYYLRDIGIEHRSVDLRTDDLVKRLRAGG
jgi:hypothetical protein